MSESSKEYRFYRSDKLVNQFILEENGVIIFTADFKLTAFKKQFVVRDVKNEIKAKIVQCISPILPKFKVITENQEFIVKRQFSFSPKYTCGNLDWQIISDYSGYFSYCYDKKGEKVFGLKKHQKKWNEEHTLVVFSEKNILISFALATVIHLIKKSMK